MQAPDHSSGRRKISPQTLIVASGAAVVASFLVSRLWVPGTLIGAAATPVFVALASELLRRPVETVSATAKRVPVVQHVPARRQRAPAFAPDATRVRAEPHEEAAGPPVDPGYVATVEADASARRVRPRWGLVLATAAIAFTIVVAIYTVPDIVAGRSITGSGRATTFFGGSHAKPATQTVTQPAPTTITTTTPVVTTTVPAPTTTVPAPPPSTTTPAPTTGPETIGPTTTPPPATAPGTSPPATTAPGAASSPPRP